jgi:hypothetical protein
MKDDLTTIEYPARPNPVTIRPDGLADYYEASAEAAESLLGWALSQHGDDVVALQKALRTVDIYCKVRTTIGGFREKASAQSAAWDPFGADPIEDAVQTEQAKNKLDAIKSESKRVEKVLSING